MPSWGYDYPTNLRRCIGNRLCSVRIGRGLFHTNRKSGEFMRLEYLDPSDWSLKLIRETDDAAPEDWILVPTDGNIAVKNDSGVVVFYKDSESEEYFNTDINEWKYFGLGVNGRPIIWQRATHPEELPFIDDEPKITAVHSEPFLSLGYILPKPRQRVYAVMGDDDCIRIPKLTACYLFNVVQTLGFASEEQKGAILYHLNYLKVY